DVALRVVAGAAVDARAAGDGRRDDDAVADLEVAHVRSDLLDDADAFVAEDGPRLHPRQRAADHVQIGAADGARREPHDGVGLGLDRRLRHVVEPDVPDPVENDGLHAPLPAPRAPYRRFSCTVSTGTFASRSTSSATLPRSARPIAPRPCVPTTMRSAPS